MWILCAVTNEHGPSAEIHRHPLPQWHLQPDEQASRFSHFGKSPLSGRIAEVFKWRGQNELKFALEDIEDFGTLRSINVPKSPMS
jgi:hypothetical protein